jgi:phosphoglycolate phosphatase
MSLQLHALDAALMDLDGTLVNTLGDFAAALQATLNDLPAPYAGFVVTPAWVEPLIGKGTENLLNQVLALVEYAQAAPETIAKTPPPNPTPSAVWQAAWDSYHRHYPRINGQYATVYDGVREGLQRMQARGWRMACVTNKPTAFAQALLRNKGLDGFFAHTFGGDAFEKKKPHPLPLLKACEALGTLPARTVMVGDSSNDAQAARAAGCSVVLVDYGFNHGEPVGAVDADAHIHRLDQWV